MFREFGILRSLRSGKCLDFSLCLAIFFALNHIGFWWFESIAFDSLRLRPEIVEPPYSPNDGIVAPRMMWPGGLAMETMEMDSWLLHWCIEDSYRGWITGWWFGTFFIFSHILGIIIPIDVHIFRRGRSTTNQIMFDQPQILKTPRQQESWVGWGIATFTSCLPVMARIGWVMLSVCWPSKADPSAFRLPGENQDFAVDFSGTEGPFAKAKPKHI